MASRTDRTRDPDILAGLLVTRRGQAYYSRKLNELRDKDLDGPSRVPGVSRRAVIAEVGLGARELTRLVEFAGGGILAPLYASLEERQEDIAFTATLPAKALRNLSDHAAIHLNVEWRDLPANRWTTPVQTLDGQVIPVSETIWRRALQLWRRSLDLGNGARYEDAPSEIRDRLGEREPGSIAHH